MTKNGKKLESHGQYKVWLRGSQKYITRAVWYRMVGDREECFIKWYGKFHEVHRGAWCYYTVASI